MPRGRHDTRSSGKHQACQLQPTAAFPADHVAEGTSSIVLPVPKPARSFGGGPVTIKRSCEKASQTNDSLSAHVAEAKTLRDEVDYLRKQVQALVRQVQSSDRFKANIDVMIELQKNSLEAQNQQQACIRHQQVRIQALEEELGRKTSQTGKTKKTRSSRPALPRTQSTAVPSSLTQDPIVKLPVSWFCQCIENLIELDIEQSHWPRRIVKKFAEQFRHSYRDIRTRFPFELTPWQIFCRRFRSHFVELTSANQIETSLHDTKFTDEKLDEFIKTFRSIMYSAPLGGFSDDVFSARFLMKLPRRAYGSFISDELVHPAENMEELFRRVKLYRK